MRFRNACIPNCHNATLIAKCFYLFIFRKKFLPAREHQRIIKEVNLRCDVFQEFSPRPGLVQGISLKSTYKGCSVKYETRLHHGEAVQKRKNK